jgi:adenylosuccinate synthase
MKSPQVDVVLGLQRGDEGKGRIVDLMARDYDIVVRFNGGPNAGHTIAREGSDVLKLHQLPSGIAHPGMLNIVGNGAYVDPIKLLDEIEDVISKGVEVTPENIVVSDIAHLILPHHIKLDELREAGTGGQGSTKSGIAYVASEKYEREGVRAELILDGEAELYESALKQLQRVHELWEQADLPDFDPEKLARDWAEKTVRLAPYIGDTVSLIHEYLDKGSRILAEGAQAFGLDIEHGMYPYVTSSHTTAGGVLNGLGIGARHIGRVIGVAKATKSHVGGGPFVTEIEDAIVDQRVRGEKGSVDAEYGATTGRERRVGYLDLPELLRAILVNGVTELALTKLDAVPRYGDSTKVAILYELDDKELVMAPSSAKRLKQCRPVYSEDLLTWRENISDLRDFTTLPQAAKDYVSFLSERLGVPITTLGVGPEREQVISR